jgi:type IV pilus assembly protein PilY1
VITYTVAIQSPTDQNYKTNDSISARALLQSAANQGGGEYVLGQDGQAVLNAVLNAIRKMLPQNSVFAAVTLPVSVNVRGTFLNQVYMGQFRPDPNARAFWPGNLKQYQIAVTPEGEPFLSDRSGSDPVASKRKNAEDTTNGFLKSDITSFWTRASGFWSGPTFVSQGMTASDAPDGSIVEKGGTAQRQRMDFATSAGRAARNLYTCDGGKCTSNSALSSVLFNTSNSSIKTQLGLATTEAQDELIDWVRGVDNKDENGDADLTDVRAYLHGDLLHSRPAVVNYNRTAGNRDVFVYYGSNDGLFRAVKGGQDDTDGYEKWGMVFPEFLPKLASIRANDKAIGAGLTDFKKPYFADGPVSIFQHDVNADGRLVAANGDKVWMYVAMRRGGRFIYALDVSDPDVPKFMWKIDNTKTFGSNAVFADLGQTWSTVRPTVIRHPTVADQTRAVLIFGGGYDPINEDPNPALAGNVMGNAIFVVDAQSGDYIHRITHPDMGAIAADLTLLDRNGDGKTDRIYAVDTKANLWRVDADNADVTTWTVRKLAALGGSGADARKFLNKPDVVLGTDFDAVLVGAGDREHPFEEGIVDRFYMIKDKFLGVTGGYSCATTADPAAACTHADLVDVTSNQLQGGTLPADKQGWYITFRAGEKMVSSPVTVFGSVIFGTNQRVAGTSLNSCYNLGVARLYQVNFLTGGAVSDLNADGVINADDRSEEVKGGGYLPSAVYSPVVIDGKRRDVVCVGTHCFKPGGQAFDTSRTRTYWYKK